MTKNADWFANPAMQQLKALDADMVLELTRSPILSGWLASEMHLDYWQMYNLNAFPVMANGVVVQVLQALELPEAVHTAATTTPQAAPRGGWYWPSIRGHEDRLDKVLVTPHHLHIHFHSQRRSYEMEVRLDPLEPERYQAVQHWLGDRTVLLDLLKGGMALMPTIIQHGLIPPWRQWRLFASTRQPPLAELGAAVRFVARLLALQPVTLMVWRDLSASTAVMAVVQNELMAFETAHREALSRLPTDPQAFWAAPVLPAPVAQPVAPTTFTVMQSLPAANFWPTPEENALLLTTCEKTYKAVARKLKKLRPEPPAA